MAVEQHTGHSQHGHQAHGGHGDQALLRELEMAEPQELAAQVAGWRGRGATVLYVVREDKVAGAWPSRTPCGPSPARPWPACTASAGIVLVADDPRGVLGVIGLSQASYRKMLQNLGWATGYNLLAVPVGAGVLAWAGLTLAPALGAALMS